MAGMLALALALSPAILATAPFAIVTMQCATTAARSLLWTVSYPLAADGAERSGAGMGVVMGLLNGVWAATVLLGPLAAGLAAGRLSAQAVFGLTAVACLAMLAVTVLVAGAMRRPARVACAPGGDSCRATTSFRAGSSCRAGAGAGTADRPGLPRHQVSGPNGSSS